MNEKSPVNGASQQILPKKDYTSHGLAEAEAIVDGSRPLSEAKLELNVEEINQARLKRWQQESASRSTWSDGRYQDTPQHKNDAVAELMSKAQNSGATTPYSHYDNASTFEKAVMIGSALAMAPNALITAAGYVGSALTMGGPLAEVGMLSGALGDAAVLRTMGGVGGGLAMEGRKLLDTFGIFGKGKGVESVMQAATKHPLAGLSSENVLRLADEIGLATPKDQLILWSGLGRGDEGVQLAMNYARVNGGITLEMTQGGSWLNKMSLFESNSPFTFKESIQIWERVSTKMIQQASGQVRSLVGQVRPTNIYRAEQSEILMNSKVTGLDELYLKPRFVFGRN